jgi:large subunit ribosomal protein L29
MEPRATHLRSLRNLTGDELDVKIREMKKDLFTLRFQLVAGRIENPAKIKSTRRELARMKTIAKEKALGLAKGRATS